jgi:hypothetical protein
MFQELVAVRSFGDFLGAQRTLRTTKDTKDFSVVFLVVRSVRCAPKMPHYHNEGKQ